LIVNVSGVVLPAERLADELMEQVTVVGVQVKPTAPAKPFTDEALMVTVPEPPVLTGTIVVSGMMEKSESGLARFVTADVEGA
jgi:hypothetical protein